MEAIFDKFNYFLGKKVAFGIFCDFFNLPSRKNPTIMSIKADNKVDNCRCRFN